MRRRITFLEAAGAIVGGHGGVVNYLLTMSLRAGEMAGRGKSGTRDRQVSDLGFEQITSPPANVAQM